MNDKDYWKSPQFLLILIIMALCVLIIGTGDRLYTITSGIGQGQGRIVYAFEPVINGVLNNRTIEIYIMNPVLGFKKRITRNNYYDNQPNLSPDRKRIVFNSNRSEDGASQIFLIHADGTNERQLTSFKGNSINPVWISNEKIVFRSQEDRGVLGRGEMLMMNVDDGTMQPLSAFLGFDVPGRAHFSADGSKILYVTSETSKYSITEKPWTVNRDGTKRLELPSGYNPVLSPDGTKVAFSRRAGPENARNDIFVMNADGSNITELTKDGYHPCWSPDGRHILYARGNGRELVVMSADGTNKRWLSPKQSVFGGLSDMYMSPHWR